MKKVVPRLSGSPETTFPVDCICLRSVISERLFTLRLAQIRALEDAANVAFESKILAFMREHYDPDFSSGSPQNCQTFIQIAVQAGRRLGFETERDITGFVILRWAYGADFPEAEKFPWAAGVLTKKTLSVSEKIALLMKSAPEVEAKGFKK